MQRMGLVLAAGAALFAGVVSADVSLPNIFNHNMVLQRGQPVPVWGWAAPGEQVTVSFAGQTQKTEAGKDGAWRVTLRALQASSDPATFTVSGANTVTFNNVVVGEVWFCSGQSNMAFTLGQVRGIEDMIAASDIPAIRHMTVPRGAGDEPLYDFTAGKAEWVQAGPETAARFSAVAYFFGREIHRETGAPIGLITSAVGGTAIDVSPFSPLSPFIPCTP